VSSGNDGSQCRGGDVCRCKSGRTACVRRSCRADSGVSGGIFGGSSVLAWLGGAA